MKRVLVTGASGFIGRHCLAPLVERGYEVVAVSSKSAAELEIDALGGVRWERADLLDPAAIEPLAARIQPSHLLHLAWIVTPGKSYAAMENLSWTRTSLELVEACARHGCARAVVAGTCYEYQHGDDACHEERTPRISDSRYGAAKNALHDLLMAFGPGLGVNVAWPRLFFLYGPHEHPQRLASSVACSLLAGEEARCSHGQQLRDYLYVEDAGEGLAALLDSELSGAVNLASGAAVALKTLVEAIGQQVGRPELIRLGAIPARANEVPRIVADTGRMTGELGWRPRFGLAEGVERTVRFWQDSLASK